MPHLLPLLAVGWGWGCRRPRRPPLAQPLKSSNTSPQKVQTRLASYPPTFFLVRFHDALLHQLPTFSAPTHPLWQRNSCAFVSPSACIVWNRCPQCLHTSTSAGSLPCHRNFTPASPLQCAASAPSPISVPKLRQPAGSYFLHELRNPLRQLTVRGRCHPYSQISMCPPLAPLTTHTPHLWRSSTFRRLGKPHPSGP